MKGIKHCLLLLLALTTMSVAGFAATQAVNTNTVSPTLAISATIQKAVSLTLATGTAAVSHCAVVAGGGSPDYTMNFGTVDALGINNGNCNKFAPTTPGVTNAVYWTDYNLTPVYTSHSSTGSSSITAYVSTNFAGSNIAVLRSATANSSTTPSSVSSFANMATSSPGDTIANAADLTAAGNGGTLTRFIGVSVAPTNGGANLTGGTATVTFTLTVN
jgi:hypothetical protein